MVPEEPWAAVESPASAEDEDLAPFLFLGLFRLPYSMKGAVHTLTCPGRCHSLLSLMAFSSAKLCTGCRVAYFSTT